MWWCHKCGTTVYQKTDVSYLNNCVGEPTHCYNRHCCKRLTDDDFVTGIDGHRLKFGKWHMCAECWDKFDGQKMRGRFNRMGILHTQLVQLGAQMDQQFKDEGGCPFTIGHPSDEPRYTESMDEWIGWQAPESEL